MDALECLKTRRSIRSYERTPVEQDVIDDIIDCARLAPTAINIQPWEFVVVTDEDVQRKIADFTDHGKFIAHAPVCVGVFCEDTKYYLEDGCAATVNILHAAHAHGLGSCWVAGDKKPYANEIRELLGVPSNYKLISLVSIGHTEENPTMSKRSLHTVLHREKH